MPPSTRTKKSSSTSISPSSRSHSSFKENVNPLNNDGSVKQDTKNTHIDDANSAGSLQNVEGIDTALLDEEEIPGQSGDDHAEPPGKYLKASPGKYIAGGGGYNRLKSFNGQVYSGMAVGGSHTWNYDQGVWHETKEEPDLWKIDYETTKRRAKKAPQGSGAPVGTEYHWLIVAHQYVKKTDANTYETHLTGSKYKLAHKNSSSNSWSIPSVKAQREHEIELLEDAKRRVQGLPPVLAGEKVKVEKHEKGQQKLDNLFSRAGGSKDTLTAGSKRKRVDDDGVKI